MTNEITLLKAIADGATINPNFQPQNNKQAYLAYLCGLDIKLPEPRSVEEVLLYKMCVDGVDGAENGNVIKAGTYKMVEYLYGEEHFTWSEQELRGRHTCDYGGANNEPFTSVKNDGAFSVDYKNNGATICEIIPSWSPYYHNAEVVIEKNQEVSAEFKAWFDACYVKSEVVGLDFSGCSLSSEVAVGVFKSLRDVTAEGGKNNQIILTGNPCVTGIGVFKSGRKTVKNHDEVCAIFNDIPLDAEISVNVDNEGMIWYASLEIALDQLQYVQYPMEISWEDVTYYVKKLTDEDRAIATNKGWTLVEA